MPHIAYEFHGYRFEPFNARLLAGPDVIPLTAKASDTLLVLVQKPDVIVTKQDLMAAVWPGVAVEENNLNQQISTLRKALSRDDRRRDDRNGAATRLSAGGTGAGDRRGWSTCRGPAAGDRAGFVSAGAAAAQRDRHHGPDRGDRRRAGGGREFRRRPRNVGKERQFGRSHQE